MVGSFFPHLLDVAVPTPFVTELPPTKTGQHLDAEQTEQIVSKHHHNQNLIFKRIKKSQENNTNTGNVRNIKSYPLGLQLTMMFVMN